MSTSVAGLSTNFFPSAQNGFTTTTSGSVASGAATVGLNSVAGYNNGEIAVFVIDPSDASKKQTFTGVIDTSGVQVTSVKWTAGTNQIHALGATVVDYETATHWSMMSKGLLISHNQDGTPKSGITYPSSTFLTPTIASFVNANHSHANAAGGGTLGPTAFTTASGINYRLGLAAKTTTGDLIPNAYTTYCTVTATSLNKEVEISYGANIQDAGSGLARSGHIRIQVDGVTLSGSDIIWETVNNNFVANPNMIIPHTPTAASHTWTLQVEADTASASYLQQAYLRVNQII